MKPTQVWRAATWPIQDIVLLLGFCARINTILCAPTLCLGTPPHPVIARTIVQYNVSPRPPVIAIYTTQYWHLQYRVKAKLRPQPQLGVNTILLLRILYGGWHTKEGSVRGRVLRNGRAIVIAIG